MAPEKASCKTADYQDIQEQLDYGGIPSEKKTEPKPEGGSEPKPEGGNTGTKEKPAEEKPKVVTKLMTGSDVKEIQTILHKQGFGDIVGSVDGKLGPKTLAGIKQLFLGVTRPKIEAITLKPKDIKPLTTKSEPSTQLAEDIQKNFNRFL
jgi:hypothetical protein